MKRKNPHAVALGRKGAEIGGAVRSAIKALAARENGKKGGGHAPPSPRGVKAAASDRDLVSHPVLTHVSRR